MKFNAIPSKAAPPPRPPSYLTVQIEPKRGEVSSESEGDEVGVRLRGADEREQADHAELVGHHRRGNVLYCAVG